jgi:pimeloyl-ACP methyl ester carboxylesterase
LLLLPGTLGRADIFWQQIDALRGRAQILSVSYPDAYDMRDWADDICQLLDQEKWTGVTVLGSSLGGYFAQFLVNTLPEYFSTLIAANTLCDVSVFRNLPPYNTDILTTPIDELRQGWREGLRARETSCHAQAELIELLLTEVNGRIPPEELKARLAALKEAPALGPTNGVPGRRFTIESEDDPLIPADVRAQMRRRIDPEVAYIFAEGGHFPYTIRPSAYTAVLEEVLGLEVAGNEWGDGRERRQ